MTGAHRVAVLGCGDWGKNLVRNFHALGALAGGCGAGGGNAWTRGATPRVT
jgi:UDP-2-acetamido-3-amino-2,3-dideoxy-glucuronate N-acetyltransferase